MAAIAITKTAVTVMQKATKAAGEAMRAAERASQSAAKTMQAVNRTSANISRTADSVRDKKIRNLYGKINQARRNITQTGKAAGTLADHAKRAKEEVTRNDTR